MVNCPPLGAICSPAGVPCGVATVCPQCWGREAIAQWSALDSILFGPKDKSTGGRPLRLDAALVTRCLSVEVPLDDGAGKYALPFYLDRRIKPSPLRSTPPGALPSRSAEFRGLR